MTVSKHVLGSLFALLGIVPVHLARSTFSPARPREQGQAPGQGAHPTAAVPTAAVPTASHCKCKTTQVPPAPHHRIKRLIVLLFVIPKGQQQQAQQQRNNRSSSSPAASLQQTVRRVVKQTLQQQTYAQGHAQQPTRRHSRSSRDSGHPFSFRVARAAYRAGPRRPAAEREHPIMHYLVFPFAIVGGCLAFSVTAETLPAEESSPSATARIWSNDAAFLDIGRAISRRKDFPRPGTDVQGPLRVRPASLDRPASSTARRRQTGEGAERNEPGHQPEWSHALQAMLAGAGVVSRRVSRVDKALSPGMSIKGGEPSMARYPVEERTPRPGVSARLRCLPGRLSRSAAAANALTVNIWGDRPLSPADKLPRDLGRMSWLKKLTRPSARDAGYVRLLYPLIATSKASGTGPIAHTVFLGTTALWLLRSR